MVAATGRETLAALRRTLAADEWPAGAALLTGEDPYHLDRAQRELLRHLAPGGAEEMALTVFDDEAPLGKVLAAVRSVGMFSPRRVVFVRDAAALDGEPEPLVEYARRPPAGSHLLIRAPALDRRLKLHKALLAECAVWEFRRAESPAAEIAAIAADKGGAIERDALELLVRVCGHDLHRADAEIEKALAWIGAGRTRSIDRTALQATLAGTAELSGWALAQALVARDRPAALAAARGLVAAGEEPLRILGGVAWHLRQLLAAKAGGGARQDVRQGAARYTLAECLAMPRWLLEADRTLKSRAIDAQHVLEQLAERVLGPETARGGKRR